MTKTKEQNARPAPPYAPGTFKVPKAKELIQYILGREGWVVEVEGGKRGSKDVLAIKAWSDFLMVTPDREHLVLGKTLEHAIVTVLQSQGFGLKYTIPSGEFVRESVGGAGTRGLYKFTDAYGVEKKIYFYGNEKKDDYSKFKGFTLGSVYINEANEQHINGLREAKDRTNSAMRPRVIVTQNPKGASHSFYTVFEKPLIYNEDEALIIRNIQTRFSEEFEQKKQELLSEMKKEKKDLIKRFLSYRKVPKTDLLSKSDYMKLMTKVRDLKEQWNKKIRDVSVRDITDEYNDNPRISRASMQLVMNFKIQFNNPNNVNNGLDFAYFHFTHYNNPAMGDNDRARVERTYDTSSPQFKRDIMGERATVDNAIWPTFNEENIYDFDYIPEDAILKRVIGVDLGYDHPFAGVDAFLLHDGTLMIHDEFGIFPNEEKERANNTEYIKMIRKQIEGDYHGIYDKILVDPSAKGFINQCLQDGLMANKAKNRVRNYEPEDTVESDHSEDRKTAGINLVREGFKVNRIMVHKRCKNTIKQIQGYAYDDKKLENGVEAPKKINDDWPDALRYVVNTEIAYVSKWKNGGEFIQYVKEGQEKVLGEQVSQEEKEQQWREQQKQISKRDALDKQQELAKRLINSFKGQQNRSNSRHLF